MTRIGVNNHVISNDHFKRLVEKLVLKEPKDYFEVS